MTRPFQYDTYVKSQIGIENDYENINKSHLRSTVQKHDGPFYHPPTFENAQNVSSRASLRNKINELLGLCQDQNKQTKDEYHDVMGAQQEILGLLKQEMSKNQPSNSYVRSNVQNFPNSSQGLSNKGVSSPHQGYEQNQYTPNDKALFLKSKVQDLMEENKYLKYQASQVARPEEDQEIHYLQQQIQRLRELLPQYQAQIAHLRQGNSRIKLMDLLEQGQMIRQNTISLLKSKQNGYRQSPSQNQALSQIDQLRSACSNLQEQNKRLKRTSKGTEYTSPSHKYKQYY